MRGGGCHSIAQPPPPPSHPLVNMNLADSNRILKLLGKNPAARRLGNSGQNPGSPMETKGGCTEQAQFGGGKPIGKRRLG